MSQRPEHSPGAPAPTTGAYKQINIFGHPTGVRVDINQGQPPRAPIGHWWRAIEDAGEC